MAVSTVVDDADPAVGYSGGWTVLTGSSRQWNSAIHSTSTVGASASFKFRGTSVSVFGTVPIGPGAARSKYSVDGATPVNVAIQSQPTAVYAELFFQANDLRDGDHTILITNAGTDADFQLDRIEYLPSDNLPATTFAPPPITSSSSSMVSTKMSSSSSSRSSSLASSLTSTSQTLSSTTTTSTNSSSLSSTLSSTTATNIPSTTTVLQVVSVPTTLTPTSAIDPLAESSSHQSSTLSSSKGLLAGIILASLFFLLFLIVIIVLVLRKLRSKGQRFTDGQNISSAKPDLLSRHLSHGGPMLTPFDLNVQRMSSRLSLPMMMQKGSERPFTRLYEGDDYHSQSDTAENHYHHDRLGIPNIRTFPVSSSRMEKSSAFNTVAAAAASATPAGVATCSTTTLSESNYTSTSASASDVFHSPISGRDTTYLHQAEWPTPSLHRRRGVSSDLNGVDLDVAGPSDWALYAQRSVSSAYGSVVPGLQDAPPPYKSTRNSRNNAFEHG